MKISFYKVPGRRIPVMSFFLLLVFAAATQAQQVDIAHLARLLKTPLRYTALKTQDRMVIDGRDGEAAWKQAAWTAPFTDITTGATSDLMGTTRLKMMWDDSCLYVYARMDEKDIRATPTEHDHAVYQDNAFELFIDPRGTTHGYFEFQINALGNICDLFLPKPYRNGGIPLASWDLRGLKKGIYVAGTLNRPGDTDRYWSVELAIPFRSVSLSRKPHPDTGTVWRMNFSRVEWDTDIRDGTYHRREAPEHYDVWSPQGLVNLHYPERWGYVRFEEHADPGDFPSPETRKITTTLWAYYYLEQDYLVRHGGYARSLGKLRRTYRERLPVSGIRLGLEATRHRFILRASLPGWTERYSLDESGNLEQQVPAKGDPDF